MSESKRTYSPVDQLVMQLHVGIQTLFGHPAGTDRANPAENILESKPLSPEEKQECARLMRINHCGEVCAQALYQGQAITARDEKVKELMQQSAIEENDHLAWCEQRIDELGGNTSLLNPIWYSGSLLLGTIAGVFGDKWSLGFLAETEKQVERHLDNHLQRIPANDHKTFSIVQQMKIDEAQHADNAITAGAAELPGLVKTAMKFSAKVMTTLTYWV